MKLPQESARVCKCTLILITYQRRVEMHWKGCPGWDVRGRDVRCSRDYVWNRRPYQDASSNAIHIWIKITFRTITNFVSIVSSLHTFTLTKSMH